MNGLKILGLATMIVILSTTAAGLIIALPHILDRLKKTDKINSEHACIESCEYTLCFNKKINTVLPPKEKKIQDY